MIKRVNNGRHSIKVQPRDQVSADEAALLLRRQQVSALKAREDEIRHLRERERSLEVECIAAEVALRASTPSGQPNLAPGKASEIVRTLDHIRMLESKLSGSEQHLTPTDQGIPSDTLERFQAGVDALLAWLEAPRLGDLQRTRRAIRTVLFAVTFGAIGAAITVHPAFLLLLFPVGPIVILLRSGQDIAWRRLGAERRFKETGLEVPAEWNEQSVRVRLTALRAAAADDSGLPSANDEQALRIENTERASLVDQLTEENQNLVDLMREGDLDRDALRGELEEQLRLIAEVERSQRDLHDVHSARKTATVESNDVREQLFAYLAREGVAPPNGHADTAALAQGLDRLVVRRHKQTDA